MPTYRAGIEIDRDIAVQEWTAKTVTDSVDIPYLDALAFRNASGDTATLFVLNRASGLPEAGEKHQDITATIRFEDGDFNHVEVFEFNGDNLWTINNHVRTDAVSIQWLKEETISGDWTHTFPIHSLTMIVATQKNTNVNSDSRINSPQHFWLGQNHPNPFNPVTAINFSLPSSGRVTLKIYDTRGREIRTLINLNLDAGHHSIPFDASDLPSGVYIYRLKTDGFDKQMKMVLIQ